MTKNRYITILLITAILLNMLILQSCTKKQGNEELQTGEINEIADTADTNEQEVPKDTDTDEPEPEYTETPYPSDLTVEEKIAGYEVYDLGNHDDYSGINLKDIIDTHTNEDFSIDLPKEFAATSSDIPDFAVIAQYTENSAGSKEYAIKSIYYKNVEIECGQAHYIPFSPYSNVLYTDGILTVVYQNRYYTGWAYLISDNNYTIVGEEQPVTTDDPLDTYPSYAFYVENGKIHYYSPCVTHSLYISSNQEEGGLFGYLSKESDLDHIYSKHGTVAYEKGEFELIETDSVTIREKYADLQREYKAAMFSDETYEKYPTYQEYLAAKEQKLLPEDHYYYRGKYGDNY